MEQTSAAVLAIPYCHGVSQLSVSYSALSPDGPILPKPLQMSLGPRPPFLSLADAIPAPDVYECSQPHFSCFARRAPTRRRRKVAKGRCDAPHIPPQHGRTPDASVDTAGVDSLRLQFDHLEGVPSDRIFLVRKLHRLGLDSANPVRAHFSAYGAVEDVLVSHSPVMSGCKTYVRRLRPSNLAIVIMARAEMAEAVHSDGSEHFIGGGAVRVERYERRGGDSKSEAEVEADADALCTVACRDAESCGDATGDTKSTGISSGNSEDCSDCESEPACISGDFEYWATDDEGLF